jgi:hypothetical protein
LNFTDLKMLSLKAHQCERRTAAEVGKVLGQCTADLEQERKDRAVDSEKCLFKTQIYDRELDRIEPKWHQHPALWFSGGFILAVVITVGLFEITQEAGR